MRISLWDKEWIFPLGWICRPSVKPCQVRKRHLNCSTFAYPLKGVTWGNDVHPWINNGYLLQGAWLACMHIFCFFCLMKSYAHYNEACSSVLTKYAACGMMWGMVCPQHQLHLFKYISAVMCTILWVLWRQMTFCDMTPAEVKVEYIDRSYKVNTGWGNIFINNVSHLLLQLERISSEIIFQWRLLLVWCLIDM